MTPSLGNQLKQSHPILIQPINLEVTFLPLFTIIELWIHSAQANFDLPKNNVSVITPGIVIINKSNGMNFSFCSVKIRKSTLERSKNLVTPSFEPVIIIRSFILNWFYFLFNCYLITLIKIVLRYMILVNILCVQTRILARRPNFGKWALCGLATHVNVPCCLNCRPSRQFLTLYIGLRMSLYTKCTNCMLHTVLKKLISSFYPCVTWDCPLRTSHHFVARNVEYYLAFIKINYQNSNQQRSLLLLASMLLASVYCANRPD